MLRIATAASSVTLSFTINILEPSHSFHRITMHRSRIWRSLRTAGTRSLLGY